MVPSDFKIHESVSNCNTNLKILEHFQEKWGTLYTKYLQRQKSPVGI